MHSFINLVTYFNKALLLEILLLSPLTLCTLYLDFPSHNMHFTQAQAHID